MNTKKEAKGFTIIEVVLVLAIAGLIFLMVFIALPSLQRSQRDTQRKNDLSRLNTAISNYMSNNRGNLPADQTALNSLVTNYVRVGTDTFVDPSGTDYIMSFGTTAVPATFSETAPTIYFRSGATCNGEAFVTASARKYAIQMRLEGSGVSCQSN